MASPDAQRSPGGTEDRAGDLAGELIDPESNPRQRVEATTPAIAAIGDNSRPVVEGIDSDDVTADEHSGGALDRWLRVREVASVAEAEQIAAALDALADVLDAADGAR